MKYKIGASWMLLFLFLNMLAPGCLNRSDSSGTTVDSAAIKAAADSVAKTSRKAADAIDSTIRATLDSLSKDSLGQQRF